MPEGTFIRLLTGADIVIEAEAPIEWRGRSAKALFALLALHPGQPVSRERLAGLLWPESDRQAARGNLRMALLLLRRTMEPVGRDLVLASNEAITLAVDPGEIDWVRFETLAADIDADSRVTALGLYAGDLADAIPGSYESAAELLRDWRERIRGLAVGIGLDLIARFEAEADEPQARWAVAKTLEIDPANESAHRAAMRLHARGGDRAAVQRQFELCRRALGDAYDVSPSGETVALRDRIMEDDRLRNPGMDEPDGDPADDRAAAIHAPPAPDARRHDAPPARRWRTARLALGALAILALMAGARLLWSVLKGDADMQHVVLEKISFTDLNCARNSLRRLLRIALEDKLVAALEFDVLLAPASGVGDLGDEPNWVIKTDAQCIGTDISVTVHLYRSDSATAEWVAQHRGRVEQVEWLVEQVVAELQAVIEPAAPVN